MTGSGFYYLIYWVQSDNLTINLTIFNYLLEM
jgi:hypothetical protein